MDVLLEAAIMLMCREQLSPPLCVLSPEVKLQPKDEADTIPTAGAHPAPTPTLLGPHKTWKTLPGRES